jgi:hypothetical protein
MGQRRILGRISYTRISSTNIAETTQMYTFKSELKPYPIQLAFGWVLKILWLLHPNSAK